MKQGIRWVLYTLGMLVLALGLTLNTKTGLGVSPIISVAFGVSEIWGLNFGDVTFLLYGLFVAGQIALRRGRGWLADLLQLPLSLAFSRVLNVYSAVIPYRCEAHSLWENLLLLAAAMLLAAAPPVRAAGPDIAAPSAILMDAATGTVLYEKNASERLRPASVTKVMTLLLVMEALDTGRIGWDDTVIASEAACAKGGSQVYLEPGEEMSMDEMLKSVVVSSANDCATALAEHVAGSESAFVGMMNQRAQELGLIDTNFVNCTGLDDAPEAAEHLTTAHDIAVISRELLKHDRIRDYTTIWMDTVRGGKFGLSNTNKLVRFYQGTTGLKTGYTSAAGHCLAASAKRDGIELIAVVLHCASSADRFSSAKALLDYGFANYALVDVYPDAPLAPVDVLLGTVKQVQPQLNRDCRLLVRKGEESQVTTQLTVAQDVEAPVDQGQTLGQMEVYVGGELRDTIPIVSAQQVDRLTVPGIFGQLLRQLLMAR